MLYFFALMSNIVFLRLLHLLTWRKSFELQQSLQEMPLFLQPSIVHDQTLQIPKNVHNLPFFANMYMYTDIYWFMYNIKTVTYSNTCELGWWIVAMIVLPFPAMSLLIFGTRIIHCSNVLLQMYVHISMLLRLTAKLLWHFVP